MPANGKNFLWRLEYLELYNNNDCMTYGYTKDH